jgi:hypothetical protein
MPERARAGAHDCEYTLQVQCMFHAAGIVRPIAPIINPKAEKETGMTILPDCEYDLSAAMLWYICTGWIY